jgi:hypothetical protein
MRKSHTLLIYPLILTASIGVFLLIRSVGKSLVAPGAAVSLSPGHTAAPQIDTALPQVLLALVVIIIAARVLGWAFRRLNQPPVIGEMVAGILLGPSLLGHVAPALSARLFPPAVMPFLSVISQIGVILYMFLVGVQLDMRLLRQRVGTAIVVSQAGIIAPFLFGAALALLLYPLLSSPVVPFTEFALFIGISMSVTAFPVLARILTDRQMHNCFGVRRGRRRDGLVLARLRRQRSQSESRAGALHRGLHRRLHSHHLPGGAACDPMAC